MFWAGFAVMVARAPGPGRTLWRARWSAGHRMDGAAVRRRPAGDPRTAPLPHASTAPSPRSSSCCGGSGSAPCITAFAAEFDVVVERRLWPRSLRRAPDRSTVRTPSRPGAARVSRRRSLPRTGLLGLTASAAPPPGAGAAPARWRDDRRPAARRPAPPRRRCRNARAYPAVMATLTAGVSRVRDRPSVDQDRRRAGGGQGGQGGQSEGGPDLPAAVDQARGQSGVLAGGRRRWPTGRSG